MNHTRDEHGLILSKRDPSKRKQGVVWEGVYEIKPDVYRSQWHYGNILTINLGEYDTAIDGAKVYTGFVDTIGDEMRGAVSSGSDFKTTVRKYLSKDPKYVDQVDRVIKEYVSKTIARNDLTDREALKQALEALEMPLVNVTEGKKLIAALKNLDTKNNIERFDAALELMEEFYADSLSVAI